MSTPKVAILMGSASDLPAMAEAVRVLERFEIPVTVEVTSAHRSPERTVSIVRRCEEQGVAVFIVGAGMAAHLAGVVAAHTTRPVLGVPMEGKLMGGLDALLSTVQMPRGVPVATLAVGRSGAANAALFAVQVLALSDERLAARLAEDKRAMAEGVEKAAETARETLRELLDG
ncbi:MAG: 5-(carboxyamino)imidazole ribonucleotide mutase [Acidobacteriota bacterium]|nr:MAG: 5-(carboxyamino)imidazole ribonucleotide mutase [Acidobacteriota bacterium]